MSFELQENFRRDVDSSPDRIVDQWRVGERLGRGTFGTVYLARDTTTGDRVALKIFDEEFESNGYLQELGLMFDESHPNTVEIISFGYTSGQKYIVYEYVGGGNLRDYLVSESRVSPLNALRILTDAARGLAYAHQCDVVHRDLKPENLLLTAPEWPFTVKICDFGLSARTSGDRRLQASYGSPAYMAPEQFDGSYDRRVDFYSIGVILYEMLFGRRPLSGDASAISHAHEHVGIQLPEKGSPGIRRLLQNMLASDPEDRYDRARDLLEDLQEVATRLEEGRESRHISEPQTRQLDFEQQWAARLSGVADCWRGTRDGVLQIGIRQKIAALTPDGQLFELAEAGTRIADILPGGIAESTVGWRHGKTLHIVHEGERVCWDVPEEFVDGPIEIRIGPRGELVAILTDGCLQVHRFDGETMWRATIDTYGTIPAFCFTECGSRMWLSTEEPRTQLYCLSREGEPLLRTTAPASDFSLCSVGEPDSVTVAAHGTGDAYKVGDDGYIDRELELFAPAVDIERISDAGFGVASAGHVEVVDADTLESRALVKYPAPELPTVLADEGLFQVVAGSGTTNIEYWNLEERGRQST